MKIGIAADHGGWQLKSELAGMLRLAGHEIVDFGAGTLDSADDYPIFVIPMARAVVEGSVERGIALCGSGVGASIAANKVAGIRAALVNDPFSARQGVEDDDMNVICFGGKVIGIALATELVNIFLAARFSGIARHSRRIAEVSALETPSGHQMRVSEPVAG
ncbi:RpiB/LacA/LacB family sugar-phosphate isomerase [Lichenicola sp.]|uniref:RpiB/LacA/LacB family sugar-phosphate isomerase n=1 Tax=Lichenicola sp. TaxID=2804529 RepID=UPI003AFFBD44